MLFNSYIFLFLFLPIALAGYYILNKFKKYELGLFWLMVMSLWFYAYYNSKFLYAIGISILVNYGAHRLLHHLRKDQNTGQLQKLVLIVGIVANISALGVFKYMNFLIENVNALFQTSILFNQIILPLGISFITFAQIAFLVDTYRGEARLYSIVEYGLFITYFPKLISGPIAGHEEMISQFNQVERKQWDSQLFAKGVFLFVLGLGKKVLIADLFGKAVNWGYSYTEVLDSTNALLLILFYTIQIYFDFSGYCDMGMGISYLFGIELPVNFNSPYKAKNISEFWNQWHITLNRFFTKYLYIPLGGSRKGKLITYRNLFLVFLISGLWHGAGWTFLIWGMIHGITSILTRALKGTIQKIPAILTTGMTFFIVNIAWVYFRSGSVSQANLILKKVLAFDFHKVFLEYALFFNVDELWFVLKFLKLDKLPYSQYYIMFGFIIMALWLLFRSKNAIQLANQFKPKWWSAILLAGLCTWCILSFSEVASFVYFNF